MSLMQMKFCYHRCPKRKRIILSNHTNISEPSTVSTKHSMSSSGYHDKAPVDMLVEKLWEETNNLSNINKVLESEMKLMENEKDHSIEK